MWLKKAGILVMLAFASITPETSFAHATPTVYVPALGATELTTPENISITFTERIERDASSIRVFGPTGEEVHQGDAIVGGEEGRTYSVDITDAGQGVYTISWQVVSVDDGHFTKGASSFLVDATGAIFEGNAGGFEVQYVTSRTEAIFDFVSLLGESILVASFLVLLYVLRPLYKRRTDDIHTEWQEIQRWYTRFVTGGFVLLLLGSTCTLIKKTLYLAELRETAFSDVFLTYLLSSVGIHTLAKVILGILFLVLFLVFRRSLFDPKKPPALPFAILAILLAGIVWVQSDISHAAASHFQPALSVLITALHLFAKALLVGGILMIALLVYRAHKSRLSIDISALLIRYDVLATYAIFLGATTGVYITWLHLKDFSHLTGTEWGERFILLGIFALFFAGFRLMHQFFLSRKANKNPAFKRTTLLTVSLECFFALVVLFYSGYISLTTPPYTVQQYSYQAEEIDGARMARLEVHPYEHDKLRLSVTDVATNAPVSPEKITITATNRERGVGPNILTTEGRATGSYVFNRSLLSPPGSWNITAILEYTDAYNSNFTFSLQYPEEIDATRSTDDIRTFDGFAQTMFYIGVVLSVTCLLLIVHAVYIKRKHLLALSDTKQIQNTDTTLPLAWFALGLCGLVGTVWLIQTHVLPGAFEKTCVEDGFEWKQALPTRDFEQLSPNAQNGCSVHDGHYHFIDHREYQAFLESL